MKRGFTLIELLAVIVILAIITLIAVPLVLSIINDSKKESLQRSIDLYIDSAQKAVAKYQMTHSDFNPSTCTIKEKGNLDCNGTEIEVEIKGQAPESGTITFQNNKIYYDVELEGMEYIMDTTGKKEPQKAPLPATGEDYRGYYADVNGDGTVDGIIYADLNNSSEQGAKWHDSNGAYTYTAKTNLNEYTVSNNTYKKNDGFGENKIIKLKKDKGNPRFYVMALEDFTTEEYIDPNDLNNNYPAYSSYQWYQNGVNPSNRVGRMTTYETDTSLEFGKGYANTGKIIEIWNKNGTGEGSYSGATQCDRDIFKHIQTKYQEGWYLPSLGEWAAFGDYFANRSNLETKLTTDNYNNIYKLSTYYWSSSQYSTRSAWVAGFSNGHMYNDINVDNSNDVRLGITF